MVDDVTFCSSMANVGEFYIGGGYKNRQFAKINPSPIFRVIRYMKNMWNKLIDYAAKHHRNLIKQNIYFGLASGSLAFLLDFDVDCCNCSMLTGATDAPWIWMNKPLSVCLPASLPASQPASQPGNHRAAMVTVYSTNM